MAPCEARFLFESAGDDSSPMMKTILHRVCAETAIPREDKK